MRFVWKWLVVFLLSLVGDVISGIHVKTLVDNQLAMAVGTVILLNFTWLFSHVAFIDTKNCKKRLAYAGAMALGAAVGTVIVIVWC